MRLLLTTLAALTGVALLALSARLSFALPGTEVPQTAQTLAVLLVGALAGPRRGAALLALYLGLGAAGAPVFADGAAGFAVLAGPTGGFLLGFLPAAAAAGWLWRAGASPTPRRFAWLTAGLIGCHGLILLCGWVRLAATLGPLPAYQAGVAPFVIGALVKSGAAAALLYLAAAAGAIPARDRVAFRWNRPR